jgi:hypothetical protein
MKGRLGKQKECAIRCNMQQALGGRKCGILSTGIVRIPVRLTNHQREEKIREDGWKSGQG